MIEESHVGRRYASRLVGLGVVAGLFVAARLPELSAMQRRDLARPFHFTRTMLPGTASPSSLRTMRRVSPSLEHLSAWISSVGASVALADLDADGLPNDVCYVDPRTDEVIVAPVPDAHLRRRPYRPFSLDPGPYYDPSRMAPMGCLPGDLNEDGRVDLLVYYWGRTPLLFTATGPLIAPTMDRSRFGPQELVPGGERWYSNAAAYADVDGDGHLDLVVGNYFADGARILDGRSRPGDPGEEMQDSMSRALNGGGDRVLLCRTGQAGSVRCHVAAARGADLGGHWTLALAAADLDGDLLPELYFANDFGSDRLLHNRSRPAELQFGVLSGRRSLTTAASKVLGHDSFKGMGVDFGDVDGDGLLDIFVSNIAAPYALEESHFVFVATGETGRMQGGSAPFVDRSEALGLSRSSWGWDARLADFDNDGTLEAVQALGFIRGDTNRWPELHELAMGNDTLLHRPGSWPRFKGGDDLSGHGANAFFVRGPEGRYFDLGPDLEFDEPAVSRGIAVADVDGDGDLDLAFANQWGPSTFYRNDLQEPATSLVLRLLLPVDREEPDTMVFEGFAPLSKPSRAAIGASATALLPPSPAGNDSSPRRLVGQVDGGNGHSGKRSPEIHFGLGRLPRDQKVRVDLRWRDGRGDPRRETLALAPGWHTVLLASGVPTKE